MLDLEAEGRFAADGSPLALDEAEILRLQAMKTGALLTASVEMGAIMGRADKSGRDALRSYGHMLGQAFQIADDLLDVESDAATLGKATGKDSGQGQGDACRPVGRRGRAPPPRGAGGGSGKGARRLRREGRSPAPGGALRRRAQELKKAQEDIHDDFRPARRDRRGGDPDHGRLRARSSALRGALRRLLDNGCDGLNICGTTGEATSFTVAQRMAIMSAAAADLPLERLMVGTGAASIGDAIALTKAGAQRSASPAR